MLRAQHKSRSSNSAPVPMVCEVCRRKPVEAVVVEFIFACDRCAEKIRPQPAISERTAETVFLVSEAKPNRQFPNCGGLSRTVVSPC